MLQRIIIIAILAGSAWWYWQGPYQARTNPSYEQVLQDNDARMAECLRGEAYRLGVTGKGASQEQAEELCADKFNVYFEDGHWHSYNRTRP